MTPSPKVSPVPPDALLAGLPAANAERLLAGHRLSHVGRYNLRQMLGENAFGGVYEAWDPLLSRSIAVRTWQFGLKMSARIAVDRLLLTAARKASELHDKHLVQVHDTGLSAHGVYITMELLRGRDLQHALQEGWAPTLGETLLLARRAADGLAALHAQGQVHTAVEPINIFITRSGRPKLLNAFVASSLLHAQSAHLAGLSLNRASYVAPEYWAAGHCDALSDLYSLGVVLNEVLTGQVAFRAESPEQLRRAIVTGRRSHLAERRPDLPRAVVDVVERMMSIDRERRPASAAEVSDTLSRLHLRYRDWSPRRMMETTPRLLRMNWPPMRWPFAPSML
ncbi:MAG: serine/threonine-protein kinase [Rubrivivax sp.]|jgi:serine/threonine protein kinase|nr:serine/threonine protein kinase [Rubrivivax sp.]